MALINEYLQQMNAYVVVWGLLEEFLGLSFS